MASNLQRKNYEIVVHSGWRLAVATMVLGIGATTLLFTFLPRDAPKWAVMFATLLLWFLLDRLVSPLASGKLFITLSEKGVSCIWTKRFFWSKLPDIVLSWDRVVEYVFENFRYRDTFRFRLTNNEEFRFYRYTIFVSPNDEFERFKHELPKHLDALEFEGGWKIREGKTEFQRIFCFNSKK